MSFEKVNHLNIQKLKKNIPKDININRFKAIKLYKFAKRLRIIEQKLSNEYHPANQMRCPVHFCIGQEAIPASLNISLKDKDYLFSHHRSHGYYLSKNAPLKKLVQNYMVKPRELMVVWQDHKMFHFLKIIFFQEQF